MHVARMVYWFVTGACLVVGLDTWVLGTCFLAGMILLLVGVFALRGREAVAVILGLGVGSAALWALVAYTPFMLFYNLVGRSTGPLGRRAQDARTSDLFVKLHQGGPPSVPLVYAVVISILITLVGLVAMVAVWRTPRRGAGPTAG